MIRKIWIVALLAIAGYAAAQDIRITRFERCYTCIGASMNPVYDNTGKDLLVKDASEISNNRRTAYIMEVNQVCDSLRAKLQKEFKKQTG